MAQSQEPVETINYRDYTIKIYPDECPESPRDWDNLGTILYHSRHYVLGDRDASAEEMQDIMNDPDNIWLPVYAYIHSGVLLNTTGFHCPWDSGQSGIIYIEKSKAFEEFGWKKLTKARRRKLETRLAQEIETFSQYCEGAIYGYVVEDGQGETVDSCWGFYGHTSAITEAELVIDYRVEQAIKKHCGQVKAWIKNRVSLNNRVALQLS